MKDFILGGLIGVVVAFLIKPEIVLNERFKAKLYAIESVLIDQEIEINRLKKQVRGSK